MDRDTSLKIQELRSKQNKWLNERQAELERERVVVELQGGYQSTGPSYSEDTPSLTIRQSSPSLNSRDFSSQPSDHQMAQKVASGTGRHPHQGATWGGGVRPEEVIDKLTERIADRLRSELKLELQRENETLQQKVTRDNEVMDDFLAKELETQNTCPICYDLMVPPDHAPQLLFPCGHTFCNTCINNHMERHRKTHCPICRKKIDSRAPNYSLQQLILNFVNKKTRMMSLSSTQPQMNSMRQSMQDSDGGMAASQQDMSMESGVSDLDRLRRQSDRIQIRLKVLQNELMDTINEQHGLVERASGAQLVLNHMADQEAEVERKMQALQAELQLLRSQMEIQQQKLYRYNEEVEAAKSRRELLAQTIEPLRAELEKLDVLMMGVSEE
ncbi:hypothetical protein CEUSTIGMA_g12061.t1 [Chlamydomonas eustigma]|uniref:RING-type domain-containing protein n=1 Tax=Chlamydomonas eustigma TaxID=1157962 RepID=A0A250XPB2_9CHLO|nr:hypothetical protein CEUSTIGMA_g12061.t1 [Chlamydomonas eustigma]|eukprot:GAX84640.1 hypothetical protein CEUSTIGMA_g12061.t1 [Chlamydomonas eustigma]